MTHYNQPRRLEILSQVAIAEYVSGLCLRIYKLIKPHPDTFDSSYVFAAEQTCSHLQHLIHTTVPCTLVNDLVSEMLKHLDYCYRKIRFDICEPWFEKILQGLVNIILHPEVTAIDVTWEWSFIVPFIMNELSSLRKLKQLKIKGNDFLRKESFKWICPLTYNINVLSNLETLSVISSCTDEVLRGAWKFCRGLKNLDVSRSVRVTDESVVEILEMRCLEKLNLAHTALSQNGYMELVEGLSRDEYALNGTHSHTMKSFGFNCYSVYQLEYIVTELRNLREVILVMRGGDVLHLRRLHNLKMLNINGGGFHQLRELFSVRGDTLLELELDLAFGVFVDLEFVLQKCTNLTGLTVFGDTCANSVSNSVHPSLLRLTLQTQNSSAVAHVLSRCPNLQVVELCISNQFFEKFLPSVLIVNPFNNLSELTIGSRIDDIGNDTLELISQYCTNVSKLKIFGCKPDEMERLCAKHPGVYLSVKWQSPVFEVSYSVRSTRAKFVL